MTPNLDVCIFCMHVRTKSVVHVATPHTMKADLYMKCSYRLSRMVTIPVSKDEYSGDFLGIKKVESPMRASEPNTDKLFLEHPPEGCPYLLEHTLKRQKI